jgi:putative ABC transport system permease protein
MLGRMAPRNLVNSLSRTSVAVAALMVAVAVTIGVSLMIGSFRYTVIVWLAQSLQGDVYVSAPGFNSTTAAAVIDPRSIAQIGAAAGVARVDQLRVANVDSPAGSVDVAASDNQATGAERLYMTRDGSPEQVWRAMQNGAVVVSEPLANRLNLPRKGGKLVLSTPQGLRTFPVVGIFYDYSSSQGTAVMALSVYRALWRDDAVTALALRLAPGAQADAVTRAIQDQLAAHPSGQQLVVRPNAALRRDVMAVFDRTFAITGALNILATLVAFVGVLSSLLLLQLEKQREVGILRAIGLTARQLWGLVMLETGLMGAAAGLLAMPTGYVLALILIYIINRRSFGWTLQMDLQPGPFVAAFVVAIAAALLAGIYPAYREGKMPAAEAMRYE